MAQYSQDSRPLMVKTALGPDVLLLAQFSGIERVSTPFSYQLELLSTNNTLNPKDLLRTPATVTVALQDGQERHINGMICRFSQGGEQNGLTAYRAELVPWLWFLSLSRDCKIFQNMTAAEIIEDVFKKQGYSDFEIRCANKGPKREFCVQYRETHLNFVSRLMEEEGFFYFFKHTASKHILVIADSNSTVAPCPGVESARVDPRPTREDVITSMRQEHSVNVGTVTLAEYDFLQPSLTLRNTIDGNGREEVYDYLAAGYTELEQGDRYARIQLEADEALHHIIQGESTCRFFQSGHRFSLQGHYRTDVNQAYTLLEVKHSASSDAYRTAGGTGLEYRNEFLAIPHSVPYRPPRRAEKPKVLGSQTAVVVGKSGEEVWIDSHGRVKVQFHWDRLGEKNENSSCWVRVSSAWAGKGWGAIHHPRIGQEVLVDFLEGDPDRPIITGRVYNAEQTPPYALPANGTQSGIKSRSSKSGGTDNFNEIRMEDKKGEELFYVQAEKDKQVKVKNDRTEEVGHDEKVMIGNDRTEEVKHDENITIGNNRTEDVKTDEKITIGGKRSEEVGGDESVLVKGKREHEVKGNEKVTLGAAREVSVANGDKLTVGADLSIKADNNIEVQAGPNIVLKSDSSIELKVGSSSIKITPAGIEMKSTQIKITGTAQVEFKAPAVSGKADAKLELQGAITQIKGDGVVKVQGGVVMIN